MRKIILVDPHSFIDVITNSSSELFVCDTDKSVKFVETFLENALDTYNMGRETNIHFREAFGEIYKIDETNFDEFFNQCIDWNFTPWSWNVPGIKSSYDFKDDYFKKKGYQYKYPYDKNLEYNEKIEKESDAEWEKYMVEWKSVNLEKIRNKAIGNVVIKSQDDNSIPYDLFELIEGVLKGDRQHLG